MTNPKTSAERAILVADEFASVGSAFKYDWMDRMVLIHLIETALADSFCAGRDAAIDYLQAEDYNIPRVAYAAMKGLTPDGKF